MKLISVLPPLALVVMMAFCAGLQVAALSPNPKVQFSVGYGRLLVDVVGVCAGILLTLVCLVAFRESA